MYQFRVKKTETTIINYLDNVENRNKYIMELIDSDVNRSVYTIKEIKNIIKPILNKHGITDINLFGSYARGDARPDSDIDIYCDKGNIRTLIDQVVLEEELENALNKKIDLVFNTARMNQSFRDNIMEDMIKLW